VIIGEIVNNITTITSRFGDNNHHDVVM